VHEVVADEDLLTVVRERANKMAALPAAAVQMTKRAAYQSVHSDMHQALELAATYQGIAQNHPDHLRALGIMPGGAQSGSTPSGS
jgi:2-(1,2-epoxy-1,2-dihydrophenyl)acetyl-CoA isomerase